MKMLSQKETEYLRFPESFNSNYQYFLKHQIKNKVKSLSEELMLLGNAGFLNSLSENSKSLRDFSKGLQTSNKLNLNRAGENEAGRVGFEPTTSSLEGWLAIRTATSAQRANGQ